MTDMDFSIVMWWVVWIWFQFMLEDVDLVTYRLRRMVGRV